MAMSWPVEANTAYLGLNLTVDTKFSCASSFFFYFP